MGGEEDIPDYFLEAEKILPFIEKIPQEQVGSLGQKRCVKL